MVDTELTIKDFGIFRGRESFIKAVVWRSMNSAGNWMMKRDNIRKSLFYGYVPGKIIFLYLIMNGIIV